MLIRMTIHPDLKRYMRGSPNAGTNDEWTVADGITVREALKLVDLPGGLEVLVTVNESHCLDHERILGPGDAVLLLPLWSGG